MSPCTRPVCNSVLWATYLLLAKYETTFFKLETKLINRKNISFFSSKIYHIYQWRRFTEILLIHISFYFPTSASNTQVYHSPIQHMPFFGGKQALLHFLRKKIQKYFQCEIQINSLWFHHRNNISHFPSSNIFPFLPSFNCLLFLFIPIGP